MHSLASDFLFSLLLVCKACMHEYLMYVCLYACIYEMVVMMVVVKMAMKDDRMHMMMMLTYGL